MIPDHFFEELRFRTSMVDVATPYVSLKRTGRNLKGLCPFHSEKSPSFMVYPENNSFYCFGCGAGGDAITFVRLIEHLEYMEAVRFLADKVGLKMPEEVANDEGARLKTRILEANREAARFFHSQLSTPSGQKGLSYLRERGLTDKTIRTFGLGYAPEGWDSLKNHLVQKGFSVQELLAAALIRQGGRSDGYDQFRDRVIFPIIDLRGTVIGFGGRLLGDGQPKYLNSADTPVFKKSRGLYALNRAKSTKQPCLLLTEGYMDAIAVHQAGFDNGVATLGTALTPEQARLMANYTSQVVLAYDSDLAGQKATARANELLDQVGLRVRVLSMDTAKDPDEYIKKHGAAAFSKLVEGSANATEYRIEALKRQWNLETDDGKVNFIKAFCVLMAESTDGISADVYTSRISSQLNLSREAIAEQIKSLRSKKRRGQQKKFDQSLRAAGGETQQQRKDPQRAQNLRYALAEDQLLTLLLKNPDYFGKISEKLTAAQVVTDSNRAIFEAIYGLMQTGKPLSLDYLSPSLAPEQMSHLAGLLAKHAGVNMNIQAAWDCVEVILSKSKDKTGEQINSMSEQELLDYIGGLSVGKNGKK